MLLESGSGHHHNPRVRIPMLNLAGARGREDQLQGTDRSSSVHARSLASQVLLLLLDLLWLAIGHMQGNAGQDGAAGGVAA